MMQQYDLYYFSFLILAVLLEIVANILLKMSDGFRNVGLGGLSLLSVIFSFSALSEAVKGIDLAVAYALWGGLGIAATIAAGWIMFNQRLNVRGWIGFFLLLFGLIIIRMS